MIINKNKTQKTLLKTVCNILIAASSCVVVCGVNCLCWCGSVCRMVSVVCVEFDSFKIFNLLLCA